MKTNENIVPIAHRAIYWILRLSCGACFIGHGAWGLITKEAWIPFFALFGIPSEAAIQIMPLVGVVDIFVGVWVLLRPTKAVLVYMAFWALFTAALRPLTGMSGWEFFERAGNYGAPLALLMLAPRGVSPRGLFSAFGPRLLNSLELRRLITALQWGVAMLLIGHGGLLLFQPSQVHLLHASLLPAIPKFLSLGRSLQLLGSFEGALGLFLLIRPFPKIALLAFGWKVLSELLFPIGGDPIWEFIERGGSFGLPLALYLGLRALPDWRFKDSWAVALIRKAGPSGSDQASTRIALAALACILLAFVAGLRPSLRVPFAKPQLSHVLEPAEVSLRYGPELLSALRKGGLAIYFRHFETTHEKGVLQDPQAFIYGGLHMSDLAECTWQRRLSELGRVRARQVGDHIRDLGIPIGNVYSSPYCRCVESSVRISGKEPILDTLLTYPTRANNTQRAVESAVHQLFLAPSEGVNTVVVGHSNPIQHIGAMREGEAYVFEPDAAGGYRLIGKITSNEWIEAVLSPEYLGQSAFLLR